MASIQQILKELKKSLLAFDIDNAIEAADNEAKTRMYLVEPFFEILRFYRGFENGNLVPEYNADFANLKGKKVDYAILFRNKPEIIIEVKKAGIKLNDKHAAQLNTYFLNTNDSKIGILTNGVEFRFYCRNENAGFGLHPSPFYVFDWANIETFELEVLSQFYATSINIKQIIDQAQESFFMEGFEEALYKELSNPSRDLVKAIFNHMNGKRLTESIESQIKELINSVSLKTTLDKLVIEESKKANAGIVTTQEELRVYHIIKTILAQNKQIETDSICYRDLKGKFSILLENNQKKKVCDLFINANTNRLEIDGEKFEIPDMDSIIKLKKKLTDKALSYY